MICIITAGWEHFAEWKKVSSEGEEGVIDINTMINGTCQQPRFLDIIENFIVFIEESGGLVKIVSKNHQYLGVNNSMAAVHQLQENQGKLGVFWHTQGSGKSISMIFFCQKVLRKVPGNWTFVIITDRKELDEQIYQNFQNAGVINEAKVQANSTKNLRKLLSEDHRYIFTLIHKFQTDDGSEHPVLSDRDNIVVITDEAHRSQYDLLAMNMRNALPNAAFLGFTGTPLISDEQQKTREVFGDYVSIYNFSQSIEDGATVPLYYEDRIPEVQLSNDYFSDELNDVIDEAGLDEAQEEKLERKFSQMYQVVTRDDRLEKVAEDLVKHFTSRGNRGKAMVISIDKATSVRMYEKVQKHWAKYLDDLKEQLANADGEDKEALQNIYDYHSKTDMAVVVSSSQNDVATVEAKGGDIRPHRERMLKEDLETKFKDADDPFRIVFVCAMWITGFDVPSCSTMYIDKPMKGHNLMQAIARVNRVFKDKPGGLVVDYIGIANELKNALYSTISSDFFAKDERENWLKKHTFTTDLLGSALSKLNAVHKNDKYPRIAVEYSTVAAEFLRNTCSFMQQEHSFLKQSWACETSDFYLMTWKELNEKLKNNYNNALDINSHLVGAITWDPVATWLEDKEESLTKIPLMLSPNGQSRPRNITFDIIVRKSRMDESSILSAVFKLSTALFESSKAVVKLNDASRTIWPVSTYFGLHKTDKTETYIRTQSALSNIRFCVYINMDYYKSIVPL